jgi:photosystem II stability/assembly factor-like uncharacterized protein
MNCPAFFFLSVAVPVMTAGNLLAQRDTIGTTEAAKWEKGELMRAAPVPDRDEILKRLDWKWECLGPDRMPRELNPGGKAIPAYAVGRGNGTGRINFLYLHPEHPEMVWACSPTGGVWRTTDNGVSWEGAGTDQLPVSGAASIAVDRKKTDRWVIATGDGDDVFMFSDGVWITENGGISYQRINGNYEGFRLPFGTPGDMGGQISDVASSPKKLKKLFVAGNRGLWVSSGAPRPRSVTWEKVADGVFYDILVISGKNRRRDIVVAAGDRMMISTDGGRTWEKAPTPGYPDSGRYRFLRVSLAHSPDDPDNVYAAVTCSEASTQSAIGEGTLQVFSLKSRTWTRIRSLRDGMNNVIPTRARAFAVSPADHRTIMCGNIQPLYKSSDRGNTFSRIEKNQMHDDCHHIVYSPDGKTVWAAHDGGVSISTNGGTNFSPRDTGIGAANVFGLSVAQTPDYQVAFGGYDTGGNLLRNGEWWHVSWGDGFETITHPADRNTVFTTMQNGGIQRSTSGHDFEAIVSPRGARTEWHTWIRQHPVHHDHIYCAGARLQRSLNLGDSWETILNVKDLDSALVNAYRFYLSEDHPGVMYVYILNDTGVNPQVWRTMQITERDPLLIRWEKVADVPVEGWIMNIAVDPDDPKRFWLLYNHTEPTGKLWYYNGSEYQDVTSNLGGSKCESMILQRGSEKRLYVGSNYGVFTRSVTESQWTLLSGLPGTYIKTLDINYIAGKLIVGTYGRGVWSGDLMRR